MKHFIRLAVFLLGFALLVILADCTLIQTDTFVALTLSEMKSRSDIELAVVGSSIVRDHFNAELISEKTGKQAFSAAVPGLSLQGELALTRELYKTNDPAYTVLVLEPYNFDTVKEDPNAQYKLMPFLSDTGNRFDYYLDVCHGKKCSPTVLVKSRNDSTPKSRNMNNRSKYQPSSRHRRR